MLTRSIPSSGEALPAVGLGTWQSFDVGASEGARAPLREVLSALFAAGGTVVDTSPMYGRAEGVAGDLLAELGLGARAFIATKVWTRGRDRGIAEMRRSMALFQSERIDLMQVHNLLDWRVHMETLRTWKADGLIRYHGITHYTPAAFDELERVMAEARPDFVQLPYSIATPDAEDRLLPLTAELGIAVLPNRPVEEGRLFRTVRGRALPPWAAEFDCASWGAFFLKYLLGEPAVTCVIPATGNTAHLADNVAAGEGRLPDQAERRRMRALIAEL